MTDDRRSGADRRSDATGGRREGDRQPGPLEARAIAVIKAAREEQKLSMEALAARAGISYGTLHRALKGKEMRVSTLEAIATALDIPPSKIFRAA